MAQESGGEIPSDKGGTWMTDKELAGGGVLLYEGYGLIDRLVRGLGIPQQVYCLTRSHASSKAIPYLAEDVAVVSLRFGEGLIGDLVLIRHWDGRPGRRELRVLWKDRTVCTDGRDLMVLDAAGGEVERWIAGAIRPIRSGGCWRTMQPVTPVRRTGPLPAVPSRTSRSWP